MTSTAQIRARLDAADEPFCSAEGQAMNWPGESGGCRSCDQRISATIRDSGDWMTATSRPMIVCSDCGNKRCPKAAWHGNTCTRSNDTDQEAYDPIAALHGNARADLVFLLAEVERLTPAAVEAGSTRSAE